MVGLKTNVGGKEGGKLSTPFTIRYRNDNRSPVHTRA